MAGGEVHAVEPVPALPVFLFFFLFAGPVRSSRARRASASRSSRVRLRSATSSGAHGS